MPILFMPSRFLSYTASLAAALYLAGDDPSYVGNAAKAAEHDVYKGPVLRHWRHEEGVGMETHCSCDVWFIVNRSGRTNVVSYEVNVFDLDGPIASVFYDFDSKRYKRMPHGIPEPTSVEINRQLNLKPDENPESWISIRARRAVEMLLNGEYPTEIDETSDLSRPRK